MALFEIKKSRKDITLSLISGEEVVPVDRILKRLEITNFYLWDSMVQHKAYSSRMMYTQ